MRPILFLALLFLILTQSHSQSATPMTHSSSNDVPVRFVGPEGLPGPVVIVPRVVKTDEEWKKELGKKAYEILRAQGTEPPFCGNLLDNHQEGIYFCAGCDLPLFSSASKFHSGTGWPSFFQPYAQENIVTQHDTSHGMARDEILCARCGGHLGHVFPDGPPPTGLRYCLNAAALIFRTKEKICKSADL
jgi:methionine-R-sulfoxide reductase